MNALELKVPPVAVVVLAATFMWVGHKFLPNLNFQIAFQPIVGWLLTLAGITVSLLGWLEFNRAKTTVNPMKPETSSKLVASGVYQRTRNPMYLGFLLLLAASASWAANILAMLMLPAFVVYMNRFQIKPEERVLSRIFGDEFKVYCGRTPRWI